MELLLMAGSTLVVLCLAWWVRRRHREVDELDNHEYGGPPIIHGQAGPH